MEGRIGELVVVLAVVLAGASLADDAGFIDLFDGKSLDGWTPEHTDRFSVREGVIFNDDGNGWLRSNKSFQNFEFRGEYRALTRGADSGVLFRTSAESTPKASRRPVKGYQLRVIDAENNFMILGHGGTPSKFDRNTVALKAAMKEPGEWQAFTLKVVGKHAEATLNGRRITVSDTINLPSGHLGLQGEHGQFEWRNLKIKELPAP
jgi:3-keto-disaccharide hydrolase